MLDSHRVTKHKDGWQVKRDGAQRASNICGTKKEAVSVAREISRNQGTELQIHKENGQIQRRDSHGRDPYPPRG